MWKYILKRLLWLIPVIIGVTLLVFSIMNIKPGDPGRAYLGVEASPQEVEEYNRSLGLYDPFFTRYFDYMKGVVKLDFGKSWLGGADVGEKLVKAVPITLKLSLFAIILSLLVGCPIGILSAVKQYSIWDRIACVAAMILASVPRFWLCMLLALWLSLKLKLLPAFGLDSWKSYILPVVAMSSNMIGLNIRLTRSAMLEEIRKDYIRTARAKGAKENTVIFKHALRNSMIPVATATGTNFSAMLGGSVFVESVYAIAGLGTMIVKAINNNDVPVIMGSVVILAVFSVVINMLIDVVYAYLDPRIKAKYIGGKKKKAPAKKEVAA